MHIIGRSVLFITLCLFGATAGANWSLERANKGPAAPGGCTLVSEKKTMSDGHRDIEVYMEMDKQKLKIITPSNLDDSFRDVGLSVDGGELIPMDRISEKRHAVFDTHSTHITKMFVEGLKARAYLRFWPTWPASEKPFKVEFSLVGFTRAYNQLDSCGGD